MSNPATTTATTPDGVRPFASLDDAVPRYESFFTVDEHRRRDRALAAEYDHVSYDALGESARGEPLWSLTVGAGSRSALLLGAPHPNEPIGSMTVDFLAHELAENDALRASLDYEFVCVPVADPDGLALNEGWLDGPFTLSNYAQNVYRPPPHRQVEATFPVERDDYAFDEPTPATRAVADLIEAHRPAFVYSLHNADFGGCYYVLSEPMAPLHGTLRSLPGEYGVPLDRGEPEYFGMEAFDEAVYRLETFDDRYEALENDEEPSTADLLGGAAHDYARRYDDDVVEFVVELPYFHAPAVADRTELDRSREAVVREGVDRRRDVLREWAAAVRAVDDLLPDTPMATEGTGTVSHFRETDAAKLEWAASADETDAPATTAEAVDERFVRGYYRLRYLGMFLRTLDRTAMASDGAARDRLLDAKAALEELLHDRLREIRAAVDYEVYPIWTLVAIQARAGLICLDHRQRGTDGDD